LQGWKRPKFLSILTFNGPQILLQFRSLLQTHMALVTMICNPSPK